MKKNVLGRGLDALIPEVKRAETPLTNEIDIARIDPNPRQPRMVFNEAQLEELTASLRKVGLITPITVRPHGNRFQLISGERRLSAAQRAGLLKIPAYVKEVSDDKLLEMALVENIQREQLNPMEEAQAYQKLMEETGETQEQIAEHLGKDRSTIANSVRLLKLPPAVSRLVSEGKLSPGHARALLASGASSQDMLRLAETILEKGLSVREAERQAKSSQQKKIPRLPNALDPNEAAAEDRLRLALGTKVEILSKAKDSGEIRIHFYSHEDLIRIFDLIIEKATSENPKIKACDRAESGVYT
jgi:ParB family chromosome partitioning protein